MSANRTLITQYDENGDPYTVYEVRSATSGPASGKRWYNCGLCGFEFREDRGGWLNGNFYCFENYCFEEKQNIKRRR